MSRYMSGLENLESVADRLRGRRLGLMTNGTGMNRAFLSTVDVLRSRFQLTSLFAVEHGIDGSLAPGESFGSGVDRRTGLPVYSVYEGNHRLTEEMLATFDTFVYDIQDVGARFYTYLYALSLAMEECAKAGKPVVVLDRVNPLGGDKIQGTVLDERFASYVGMYALPTRYGLTIGEYALWVKDHLKLDLDLTVVPMTGWRRRDGAEAMARYWVAPSPNCATLHAARAYIGTCVFEGSNVSEGRGTTLPFEQIGAPWIDAYELERAMAAHAGETPGMAFRAGWFIPSVSKHAGEKCGGVRIFLTDPNRADPVLGALLLMDEIRRLYPDRFAWIQEDGRYVIDRLLGTDTYRTGMYDGAALMAAHEPMRRAFEEERKPFLLYE